jgi:hypothetical protein
MEVLFLQDWLNPATNKIITKGLRAHIMKKKALELIADGIVEEVLPFGVEKAIQKEKEIIELKENISISRKKKRKLF